jgi:hypothetical protein
VVDGVLEQVSEVVVQVIHAGTNLRDDLTDRQSGPYRVRSARKRIVSGS